VAVSCGVLVIGKHSTDYASAVTDAYKVGVQIVRDELSALLRADLQSSTLGAQERESATVP
jgi:hypothetical protein